MGQAAALQRRLRSQAPEELLGPSAHLPWRRSVTGLAGPSPTGLGRVSFEAQSQAIPLPCHHCLDAESERRRDQSQQTRM